MWRGTHKASEHQLPDGLVGVTSFYTDTSPSALHVPVLAAAADASVYLFRNLKPYSTFIVPANGPDASPSSAAVTCITTVRLRIDEVSQFSSHVCKILIGFG